MTTDLHRLRILALVVLAGSLAGCGNDPSGPGTHPPPARSFFMGFSGFPPRLNLNDAVAAVQMWSTRADAAIIHVEMPWATILAGGDPDSAVQAEHGSLVGFYRAHGDVLVFTLDVTNGLARDQEAPGLVKIGRSITEPAVQRAYRRYALSVAHVLHPEYLGLAAETNLIRVAAPRPVYDAVVRMTNDAANDLQEDGATANLYVSVQVEVAWGRLGSATAYRGIAEDLTDFPFIRALGLSSYPYLAGYGDPGDLPIDYYSRVGGTSGLPLLVVEGGWGSTSIAGVVTSQAKQARYIARQSALLDHAQAIGLFQLSFTDLDLNGLGPIPPGSIIPLFASLGMVDADLHPKAALAVWDSVYARGRK